MSRHTISDYLELSVGALILFTAFIVTRNDKLANEFVLIVLVFYVVVGIIGGILEYLDYKEELKAKNIKKIQEERRK